MNGILCHSLHCEQSLYCFLALKVRFVGGVLFFGTESHVCWCSPSFLALKVRFVGGVPVNSLGFLAGESHNYTVLWVWGGVNRRDCSIRIFSITQKII